MHHVSLHPFDTGFYTHILFSKKQENNPSPKREHLVLTNNWTARVDIFHQTRIFWFKKQKAVCILYGNLVSGKIDEKFANSFRKNPLIPAKELNGSWALVFFDLESEEIKIVTDRFNSRLLFMYLSSENNEAVISTDLRFIPQRLRHPDWAGVGWKLANGVPHCSRTVFRDIQKLRRSSVYHLSQGSVTHQEYWKLEFTESFSNRSLSSLKKDFSDILCQAVKRRISKHFPHLISLSGGYDTRCILGILAQELKSDQVVCISYQLPTPQKFSDAGVAKFLAKKVGFSHLTLTSYHGNIFKTLALNSLYSSGVSNFCEEVQAWEKAHELFPQELPLFVGECFLGWRTTRFQDIEDILEFLQIRKSRALSPILDFFPKQTAQKMSQGMDKDAIKLVNRITEKRLENIKDYLYVDQRMGNLLLPWRPFFWGRGFSIQLPWLDNDIIDFMANLHPELRNNKYLFLQTIFSMFPDLFSIPRERTANYSPNWRKELSSNKKSILYLLQAQKLHPLSTVWEYEYFLKLIRSLWNRLPRTGYRTMANIIVPRVMRRVPVTKAFFRRFFPISLDDPILLLNLISLFGFVYEMDFKADNRDV